MLAPGDYLLKPPEAPAAPPASSAGEPPRPAPAVAEVEENEQPSFLLILLRALGAIHT